MSELVCGCVVEGDNIPCVLDDPDFTASDCIYASKLRDGGKGRDDCEYWEPSAIDEGTADHIIADLTAQLTSAKEAINHKDARILALSLKAESWETLAHNARCKHEASETALVAAKEEIERLVGVVVYWKKCAATNTEEAAAFAAQIREKLDLPRETPWSEIVTALSAERKVTERLRYELNQIFGHGLRCP